MLPGISGICGFVAAASEEPSVTLVHTSSSASESASYGADVPGRWIVVLGVGSNTSSGYDIDATISGSPGDRLISYSSGTGGGVAVAASIIVGQPSGTSGTVTVTPSAGVPPCRFFVLRVIGYDMNSPVFTDDSNGAGIPPWSANVPADGLTISLITNDSSLGAISWTGITERIPDSSILLGKLVSAAWDLHMSVNPAKAVDVTASDTNGDTAAVIATFSPS